MTPVTWAGLYLVGAGLAAALLHRVWLRLQLSRAKHRSLAGHARLSRRLASWLPFYDYDESQFFAADDAPGEVIARRRAGFRELAVTYAQRFAVTAGQTQEIEPAISDLQFTSRYRVPFQFSAFVRRHFRAGSLLASSTGRTVTDLDGNPFYDLTGSYGVNVFGLDFYKGCIERGAERVRALGPVLGAYHPVIADNVRRLRDISGLDEVSFHMSGTEAVMQAVRLARYHTNRRYLVRFCGAYHGWWGDVQPGAGNPSIAHDTLTLNDMSERTLAVLRSRRDIACVLINPLQALHPNRPAPGDSSLIDSSRSAGFDRPAYSDWLVRLRQICTERGIVLIFDEVFVGFRIARGGAQEYFGVRADMVTYGKTLGGGLPVGVVCGRADLMQRYRAGRPADICFARGTFNSHPYVMGAMNEFLLHLESDAAAALYADLDAVWNERARHVNQQLELAGLPLRVAHLSSIWTFCYLLPGRYNWMLQYYLRVQGLALSWVGTGRCIFSLDFTDDEFAEVVARIVAAATRMQRDGWWWPDPQLTNRSIRRRVLLELFQARWRPIGSISSPRKRYSGAL